MPSAPPHRWVIAASFTTGNRSTRVACRASKTPLTRSYAVPDPRAEVVRRAAAAEDEPVVGGALAVDDQVPVVAERLAPAQPDLLPHRVGQRLGGDDQASRPAPAAGARRRACGCSPRSHGSRARRARSRGGWSPARARSRWRASARRARPRGVRRRRPDRGPGGRDGWPRSRGCTSRRARGCRPARRSPPSASSSRSSSSPRPHGRACSTSACARAHCGRRPGQRDRAALGDVGVDALGLPRTASPRRRCAASRRGARSALGARRALGQRLRARTGRAPSTSRRCGRSRRSPAVSRLEHGDPQATGRRAPGRARSTDR